MTTQPPEGLTYCPHCETLRAQLAAAREALEAWSKWSALRTQGNTDEARLETLLGEAVMRNWAALAALSPPQPAPSTPAERTFTRQAILDAAREACLAEGGAVLKAIASLVRMTPPENVSGNLLDRDAVVEQAIKIRNAWDRLRPALSPPQPAPADSEPVYPCDHCDILRSKSEGGTTFTVCDACWDVLHPYPAPRVWTLEEIERAVTAARERLGEGGVTWPDVRAALTGRKP